MDQLYQLLCIPKAPSLSIEDIKDNNFGNFLEKSMKSASSISKDGKLKSEAGDHIQKLMAGKSHSPTNTLRTIDTIFETASKVCHLDRERELISWLQTCVSVTVKLAMDPSLAEKPMSKNSKSTERKISDEPKKNTKKTPPKKKPNYDDDASWVESDEEDLDESDYVDDDAIVPSKPDTKKTSPKKEQKVPKKKEEPKLGLLDQGAGYKAVHSYFLDMETAKNPVLPQGYFAKAFFFPSKDSFNAFLSVLNSAKKTIDICVFAFTDDDVADVLIAAKKRNVSIRIITDNQQAAGKGADAKRLSESYDIPFKTDHTTGYMHNKFAMVDDKTLINGSFNWSKGARFKNRENVLITNIPVCIQEFQAQFDALWEEF